MAGVEKNPRTKISETMQGEWMPIEIQIASASHPVLVNVGLIAHAVYIRLIALCWELGRSELPEPYCVLSTLQRRLGCPDRHTLCRALGSLMAANAISLGDSVGSPLRFQFVRVVGLDVKWAHKLKSSENRREEKRIDSTYVGASPSAPPDSPPVSEKSTKHQQRSEFFEHWRKEYFADRGVKYVDIPGDAQAVGRVIRSAGGLSEACRLATEFIRGPDEWQRANTTIRVMQSRINALREGNGNGNGSENAIDRARRQLAQSANAG